MYDEKRHKGEMAAAREDGFAEGIEDGKMAVAQNLLRMGMSVEDVVVATGLSMEILMSL